MGSLVGSEVGGWWYILLKVIQNNDLKGKSQGDLAVLV